MWRRMNADGGEWEVRVVSVESEPGIGSAGRSGNQLLEFRPVDGLSQPRRIAMQAAALDEMDDDALLAAYRQARPIGGDYYGRPGKRMKDADIELRDKA